MQMKMFILKSTEFDIFSKNKYKIRIKSGYMNI